MIPVSVIWIVRFSLRVLRAARASTAMIRSGCVFLYHASDDFQRLHACLSHHSRNDAADRVSLFFPKRSCPEFPDHMPGDADVANHIRSECIRCHIPVSKSDDQHRFFPFSPSDFSDVLPVSAIFPGDNPHPVPTYSGLPW